MRTLLTLVLLCLFSIPALAQSEQPADIDQQIEPTVQINLPIGNGRLTNAVTVSANNIATVDFNNNFLLLPNINAQLRMSQDGIINIYCSISAIQSETIYGLFIDGKIVASFANRDLILGDQIMPQASFNYIGPISVGSHSVQIRYKQGPNNPPGLNLAFFGQRYMNIMTFN